MKFLFPFFVVLCESKKSWVPQAISQLVQDNYGERPVVIEIFHNSRKIEILDETLKLLGEKKHIKVTPINMDEIDLSMRELDICEEHRLSCRKKEIIDDCNYFKNNCTQEHNSDAIFLFDKLETFKKCKQRLRHRFFSVP